MAGPDGPRLAVVDYGIGNLRSAEKALQHVGADARLTRDPAAVRAADGVVVPGVGNFGRTLEVLSERGLAPVVRETALAARDGEGVPFLGICVGMQMLFDGSDESPEVPGLRVLSGRVERLAAGVKHPQMQWNRLDLQDPADPLWSGLEVRPWMYFVHSFAVSASGEGLAATCEYGSRVAAAVRVRRLGATQFHPEKSGVNGLRVLANFVDGCRTDGTT